MVSFGSLWLVAVSHVLIASGPTGRPLYLDSSGTLALLDSTETPKDDFIFVAVVSRESDPGFIARRLAKATSELVSRRESIAA